MCNHSCISRQELACYRGFNSSLQDGQSAGLADALRHAAVSCEEMRVQFKVFSAESTHLNHETTRFFKVSSANPM